MTETATTEATGATGPERAEAIFRATSGKPLNAREFAALVANISSAASATAKASAAAAGATGSCGRPLILSPVEQGFRLAAAPRPKRPQDIEMDFAVRDIDDQALCTVLDTLFDAEQNLTDLPHAAQQPLAHAARILSKKRNVFEVEIRQRAQESTTYTGNPEHAQNLVTEFKTEKKYVNVINGTYIFDGFKDSSDTVFLLIENTSYAVHADEELLKTVAGMLGSSPQPLKLDCEIEETVLDKPGRKPHISRRLLSACIAETTKIGEQFSLIF